MFVCVCVCVSKHLHFHSFTVILAVSSPISTPQAGGSSPRAKKDEETPRARRNAMMSRRDGEEIGELRA